MQALRKLELDTCPMPLMETLIRLHPNLEVVKAIIVIGKSDDPKLDLSFVSRLPKLYELKLNAYRKLEGFQEFLATLNLKHLYLLDCEGVHNFPSYKWRDNTTLETLGLGNCFNLSQFAPFLRSLTVLKKLSLEFCWNWDSFEVLKCVSEMNSVKCLKLLIVDIDQNFEKGLALCSNLEELTIVPHSPINEEIFNPKVALAPLKHSLKKSKWGLWRYHISEVNNSLLFDLKTVLPYTDNIVTSVCSINIFD